MLGKHRDKESPGARQLSTCSLAHLAGPSGTLEPCVRMAVPACVPTQGTRAGAHLCHCGSGCSGAPQSHWCLQR